MKTVVIFSESGEFEHGFELSENALSNLITCAKQSDSYNDSIDCRYWELKVED